MSFAMRLFLLAGVFGLASQTAFASRPILPIDGGPRITCEEFLRKRHGPRGHYEELVESVDLAVANYKADRTLRMTVDYDPQAKRFPSLIRGDWPVKVRPLDLTGGWLSRNMDLGLYPSEKGMFVAAAFAADVYPNYARRKKFNYFDVLTAQRKLRRALVGVNLTLSEISQVYGEFQYFYLRIDISSKGASNEQLLKWNLKVLEELAKMIRKDQYKFQGLLGYVTREDNEEVMEQMGPSLRASGYSPNVERYNEYLDFKEKTKKRTAPFHPSR